MAARHIVLLLALALTARAAEEVVERTQQGTLRTKQGDVAYQAANKPESPAGVPQSLAFGDSLRTRLRSSAAVEFNDQTRLRLREFTRLVIIPRGPRTNMTGARILQGQILMSHRGEPATVAVETPHAKGTPFGTEFLVSVDPDANETVFTMFDGEVELDNGVDKQRIKSGFQGIAVPGQKIRVQPILEAKNIVQWWIYYPAVIDPLDLKPGEAEAQSLARSIAAYNAGDLRRALEQFPGYPDTPALGSESARLFYSALLLCVGDVAQAEKQIEGSNHPVARALRIMIAAVAPPLTTNAITTRIAEAKAMTASELLALSYAHQATNNLEAALRAARAATERSPEFGFAWARVAELEFSFGRTPAAAAAVEKALALSPKNGQAHALRGFLLAARNRTSEALRAFDGAIELDSALANGWLGRGLVKIRRGDLESGRNDLETAAILEPRRALLRSYTGKAFTDAGHARLAGQELRYAQKLDANDPTAWLYSALLAWQEHRINAAVDDLEHSIVLNDNRALFRSKLLLDQDRAVRGANLAGIYREAGLDRVSLNEAARAVSYDGANYSAHLFMSESFNTLRDPARFNLRYETPWFGEYLLASLLSPVGATPLSQNVSQQEYSRLFARDRVGASSDTLVRSDGQLRELASQFGNIGNTAWALDLDYQHNDGTDLRRNNRLDRTEWYTTVKQQITPQDSALLLLKYQDYESGDNFQYYDAKKSLDRDYRFQETQHPIALAGWHHEWSPGVHTLFLGGRLENQQKASDLQAPFPLLAVNGNNVFVPGAPTYDLRYRQEFEAWTAELNQILQIEKHTFTFGARYQDGEMTGKNSLQPNAPDAIQVPFRASITEPADRVTGYGYWNWRVFDSLLLIGGVSYDRVAFPELLRSSPVTRGHREKDLIAPKAGLVWTPLDMLAIRGAYTKSLGGVTLDQSYRLEPTQLAGFVQTYRTLFPISLVGPVSAQEFETAGAAVELKLPSRTYVTMQFERLASKANSTRGVLLTDISGGAPTPISGGGTREKLDFTEHSGEMTVGQLLGDEWTVGARYRFARGDLRSRLPNVPVAQYTPADTRDTSDLHAGGVFALYNHRSGLFAQSDFTWYVQDNRTRDFSGGKFSTRDLPSDEFPQWNVALGWRFPGQRGDVTFGVLNLMGENYRLSPVNFYNEMPHERVFYGRLRFRF